MAAARHRHNGTADQQRQAIDHLPFRLALDPESLEQLAGLVADKLAERFPQQPAETGWLDTPAAAAYLGISTTALHKLTAARELAFSQSGPNARCFFRRRDLDAFREQSMKGG